MLISLGSQCKVPYWRNFLMGTRHAAGRREGGVGGGCKNADDSHLVVIVTKEDGLRGVGFSGTESGAGGGWQEV